MPENANWAGNCPPKPPCFIPEEAEAPRLFSLVLLQDFRRFMAHGVALMLGLGGLGCWDFPNLPALPLRRGRGAGGACPLFFPIQPERKGTEENQNAKF